eukprot:662348-Karenia_brevis.AAC.1
MFGEQIVAADVLSWRNDKRAGQWLMLNIPFKNVSDFHLAEVDAKVPASLRYVAMARHCRDPVARDFWRTSDALQAEMRVEGKGQKFIQPTLNAILANGALADNGKPVKKVDRFNH